MKSDSITGSPAGSKTATPRSLPSSTTIWRIGAKVVLLTVALAALRPYVQTTGTASAQSSPEVPGSDQFATPGLERGRCTAVGGQSGQQLRDPV